MGEDNDAVEAPRTGGEMARGVNNSQPVSPPPAPPAEAEEPTGKEAPQQANPFKQYYAQLTHQQNMLQDSVRVTAYQRAILDNAADFKVGGRSDWKLRAVSGALSGWGVRLCGWWVLSLGAALDKAVYSSVQQYHTSTRT